MQMINEFIPLRSHQASFDGWCISCRCTKKRGSAFDQHEGVVVVYDDH